MRLCIDQVIKLQLCELGLDWHYWREGGGSWAERVQYIRLDHIATATIACHLQSSTHNGVNSRSSAKNNKNSDNINGYGHGKHSGSMKTINIVVP